MKNTDNYIDYNKIMDVAVLSGEIMLRSNAETYRIEDLMGRILALSGLELQESMVITVGLFASLDSDKIKPITVIKSVKERNTNLNKITRVNTICRRLTSNMITVDEAYEELKAIDEVQQYKTWIKNIAYSILPPFFALLFGSDAVTAAISWFSGIILVVFSNIEERVKVGFFTHNLIYAAVIPIFYSFIVRIFSLDINLDLVVTASIMPLVPGTAITNAFRDVLRGDYLSSGAKMLEAVVIALSIAVGVALGLMALGGISL